MIERLAPAALVLLASCAHRPLEPTSVRSARMGSSAQCARHKLSDDSPYHLELAGEVKDPALRAYLERVPADVRRTVLATGLEPELAEMLREQGVSAPTVEQLARQLRVTTRLSALDSQLAALLFESDCTGDALEDLGLELERREHARELRLTVASLVVGAVGGVVAGVWDAKDREGNGPPITAAIGAGATALLGVAAFLPGDRPVVVHHERNLLRPIALGMDPEHIYPTFVFRLLTLPMPQAAPVPREELLSTWRQDIARVYPAEQRAAVEAMLFGDGGVYEDKLLQLRQNMLDQLEARLNALTRDVELLERYLSNVSGQ